MHCQFLIPLIFELWWRHSGVCWIRRRMNCHVFEFPWFLNYSMMLWAFNVRATNCNTACLPACLPFFYWGLFASPRNFNSTYAQKAFFPINSPDDDASSGQQSQVSSKLHATSSQTDGVQNAWACNMLASWLVQRTSSNRSTVDIAKTRRQINTEHLQNNPVQLFEFPLSSCWWLIDDVIFFVICIRSYCN